MAKNEMMDQTLWEIKNNKRIKKLNLLNDDEIIKLIELKNINFLELEGTKFYENKEFVKRLIDDEIIDIEDFGTSRIWFNESESYSNYKVLGVEYYDYDGNLLDGNVSWDEAKYNQSIYDFDIGVEGSFDYTKTNDDNYLVKNEDGIWERINFEEWFDDIQNEWSRGKTSLGLRKEDFILLKNELRI